MKRFLLFVMMCVCVSIGAWAAKYSTSFGSGSSFEKNGTTLYVDVQNPGDWATYVEQQGWQLANAVSGFTTIKFSGIPSQSDVNKSGDYPLQGNNGTTRLDLCDVTSSVTSGGSVKMCILPRGATAPGALDNSQGLDYVIAPSVDIDGKKAITVSRKQGNTSWQSDEYVTDADYIFLKGNFTEADKTSLESVFGEGKVLMDGDLDPRVPLEDLTINDVSSKSVSQQIQEFLNTPKNIRALTITDCEMDDISALYGIKVQSLDLSGVTNTDLTGLVLPEVTDEESPILLPQGVTYNSGVVTSTSGQGTADQLKAELLALKNSGKEISSVTFPDGSTFENGVLTAQTTDFLEAAIGGGLDVSKVTFPGGAEWENGVLTFTTSASEANMNDIVGALQSAGFVLNSVVLSSGTTWTGGTVTLNGSDDIATMKPKFVGAGLETDGVIFTNGTKFENGKLTTVAADEAGPNGSLRARAEEIRSAFGEKAIKSLQMSDHTVWDNGTVTAASGVNHDELLENAGFKVDSKDKYDYCGKYVTEKDGVVTLTIPAGKTFVDIKDDLSGDDQSKLGSATSLKIVGETGDFTNAGLKDKLGQNVSTLDLSEAVIPETMTLNGSINQISSTLTALTLPSGGYFTKIPDGFCTNFTSLSSVNIPSQVTTIGKGAFQGCSSLSNIDWGKDCHVELIEESAFQRANISGDFVMPNSVRFIRNNAFDHNDNMKTLTFGEYSQIESIGASAFAQSESTAGLLSDVFIKVQPAREIECAHGAFDKFHAAAQTNVGTVTTRLHYPREMYEYYVGTYKSEIVDPNVGTPGVITQMVIDVSFNRAANGWQEFMSSGIPVGSESLYRTYSEEVSHLVPEPGVLEIFLVHHYDKTTNKALCVQMAKGDLIPANTGFIIHSSKVATIYLPYTKIQANPYNHEDYPNNTYNRSSDNVAYNNYLKPINGNMHIDNVEIVNGKKTYRNYFFNNGKTAASRPGPDWNAAYAAEGWGFFRAATGDYPVWNKAFLHLPADMTDASSTVLDDSGILPQDQLAKSFGMFIIGLDEDDDEGVATPVERIVTNEGDDSYYTLQGVRVNTPTDKGIYIHNGKKVIVK